MDQFFHEFENDLLEEIRLLPEVELEANNVILKENAFIREIPLLTKGSIKVRKADESGKEIILYHVQPGESCILSITSCLTEKQSNAEAILEEKSKLIVVPAQKVRDWMDKYKSWRKFVLKLYYDRLHVLLSLVDDIAFKQVDIRLTEKLRSLQIKQGNKINITHQQLAQEIGTVREVVSRLLKQLENKKLIRTDRGTIEITGLL